MEIIVLKATYELDDAILFELTIDGDFAYYAYRADDPYSGAIGMFLAAWLIEHEDEILPWVDPPPSPYNFQITTLWGRLTEDEAEEFDEAVSVTGPLKTRKQFNLATSMTSDSELFAWVRDILVGLFGETRADELLAEATMSRGEIAPE